MDTMVRRKTYQSQRFNRHAAKKHKPGKADNSAPKTKKPLVLYAASLDEYNKLKRDYPQMKVVMDPLTQTQLFDDREYIDV